MDGPDVTTIERIGPGGLPRLRALNELFAEAFEMPEAYAADPADDDALLRRLSERTTIAMVACRGDSVVGGLVAYELPKLEAARSEIYLYDLAVAAPHRRQGVATALIRALCRHAEAVGATTVFVQADRGDTAAFALYAQFGSREEVVHFDLAPGPG